MFIQSFYLIRAFIIYTKNKDDIRVLFNCKVPQLNILSGVIQLLDPFTVYCILLNYLYLRDFGLWLMIDIDIVSSFYDLFLFFCFALLFWNQIFTWDSVSPSSIDKSFRISSDKYWFFSYSVFIPKVFSYTPLFMCHQYSPLKL